MKLKIEIKNRFTGKVIFEFESENNTIKNTVMKALEANANFSNANFSNADFSNANFSIIKSDFFYVLLNAKKEVGFLKQAVIDGKIDGSTYSGECSCLSGTVERSAIIHNGAEQEKNVKKILDCRASSRPAERFFLAIRPNDTPENNQAAKIVLGWFEEFEMLIA